MIAVAPDVPFAQHAGVNGTWLTDDKLGAIHITPCENEVCGHIRWLRDIKDEDGRLLVDERNPDPLQRTRLICGLQVIGGLKKQTDGSWDGGWIYDPKDGRTHDVALSLKDPNTLIVLGYKVTKILSRTHYWTRAPAALKPCK